MILLSSIINSFESSFLAQYKDRLLPSHKKALGAMKVCRTQLSPVMLARCGECDEQLYVPHSCGHRSCPHCQHHESQQWLERQLKKQVPGEYFLLTFTLPAQFRTLVWAHQRVMYDLMIKLCWKTLNTFSHNDRQLQGVPGVIAVLHTHARNLDFHPHVHIVMPAAAIDKVSCKNGKVTFRYQNSKTKQWVFKTVSGEKFLWLVLQHVLPKRFRRTRNFGFLHPNSKRLIQVLQLLVGLDPNRALLWIKERHKMICRCCGGKMTIIKTRILHTRLMVPLVPT